MCYLELSRNAVMHVNIWVSLNCYFAVLCISIQPARSNEEIFQFHLEIFPAFTFSFFFSCNFANFMFLGHRCSVPSSYFSDLSDSRQRVCVCCDWSRCSLCAAGWAHSFLSNRAAQSLILRGRRGPVGSWTSTGKQTSCSGTNSGNHSCVPCTFCCVLVRF